MRLFLLYVYALSGVVLMKVGWLGICSVQTISGTGANHLGALFLSRFYAFNGIPTVGLSNPTWGTSPPHNAK